MRVVMTYESESLRLGGQPLFTGPSEELISALDEMVRDSRPHLITTPNVDQVVRLTRDVEFRRAFDAASLRLIDGMPLVFLSRMLGAKRVRRNTGADLLPGVSKVAADRNWTVLILGGSDTASRRAASLLSDANPGSRILSVPFPYISSPTDPASAGVIGDLASANPDVVFLCLGAPKQELWFMNWRDELPPAVYVGAGAAVDFVSGAARRAPSWAQKMSLEWVWRLSQEPKRLGRRYLLDGPRFIGVVTASLREGMRS